jgi:hypothetical protein
MGVLSRTIQGAVFGASIGAIIVLAWRLFGGGKTTSKSDVPQWKTQSDGFKMAVGAMVAVALVSFSELLVNLKTAGRSTFSPFAIAGSLFFAGVTGAAIGDALAIRDRVLDRLSRREHVNIVLRALFSSGVLSLLLWSVFLFAAGIGAIVLYHTFLSPGVTQAR